MIDQRKLDKIEDHLRRHPRPQLPPGEAPRTIRNPRRKDSEAKLDKIQQHLDSSQKVTIGRDGRRRYYKGVRISDIPYSERKKPTLDSRVDNLEKAMKAIDGQTYRIHTKMTPYDRRQDRIEKLEQRLAALKAQDPKPAASFGVAELRDFITNWKTEDPPNFLVPIPEGHRGPRRPAPLPPPKS